MKYILKKLKKVKKKEKKKLENTEKSSEIEIWKILTDELLVQPILLSWHADVLCKYINTYLGLP